MPILPRFDVKKNRIQNPHVVILGVGRQNQVKVFSFWSEPSQTYGDTIPTTIYFNMDLIRIHQDHEININKQNH